jgi:hypothetical protein
VPTIELVRDGATLRQTFDESALAEARAEADAALVAIALGEFSCRDDRSACGWCEYRGLCDSA